MNKENLIKTLKNKCIKLIDSCKNHNDLESQKKYEIILEILNVEDCFNQMNYDVAVNILNDLKINKEKLLNVYQILIGEN